MLQKEFYLSRIRELWGIMLKISQERGVQSQTMVWCAWCIEKSLFCWVKSLQLQIVEVIQNSERDLLLKAPTMICCLELAMQWLVLWLLWLLMARNWHSELSSPKVRTDNSQFEKIENCFPILWYCDRTEAVMLGCSDILNLNLHFIILCWLHD